MKSTNLSRLSARLFALVLSAASLAAAQGIFSPPPARTGTTWDLGMGAGMVGGGGVSLRRWSEGGHGLQINFAPFYWEEKYPEDGDMYYNNRVSGSSYDAFLSLGALYMKRIASLSNVSIFPYGGGNYTASYSGGTYEEELYTGATVQRSGTKRSGTFALGGGMGAGIGFWRLEASILLGLRGAYDIEKETRSITPAIDAGIHFRL